MIRKTLRLHAGLLLFLAGAVSARADLLSVGTVSGSTVEWNLSTNPTDSPSITVPILNATATPTATLYGWALSLEIVPEAGAAGTLSVATVAVPSNNVLNAGADAPQANTEPYGTFILAGNNSPNLSSTVPASGDNLVTFTLGHSANASGTFQIIAFADSNVNIYSNWTYYNQSNSGDPDNLSNYAFTNVPATGIFPTNEGQFTLGTISVNPAAMPEPGSTVLAGIATIGCAGYGWRRRRRADSE